MDFESARRLAMNMKAAYPQDLFGVFEAAKGACVRGNTLVDFGDSYVMRFDRSAGNRTFTCESVRSIAAPPVVDTARCDHGYERCRYVKFFTCSL